MEEWSEEEGRLRDFGDLAITFDPSLTEEDFPAFGRGSTLKMRYALDDLVEAAAAAVAMVARRRDAMRKFILLLVDDRRNYDSFALARAGAFSSCALLTPVAQEELRLMCSLSRASSIYMRYDTFSPDISKSS